MKIDTYKISSTYQAMARVANRVDVPDYFVEMTQAFDSQELWREYVSILKNAPSFGGGVVVDIGCKYGHALPVFEAMGAESCIGVDVDEDYLRIGNAVFNAINFSGLLVNPTRVIYLSRVTR
jgi:hypothetical protein